jgi:pimeloyl-ACP methyl ester carboxylesterase
MTEAPAPLETVATDLGPVELARVGSGPPVLVVHGMPGGSDQAVAMGSFLVDAGFSVLAPSRPGYLGTPLDGREAVDTQADLHAALLDALGISRVGVLAWSGGGPSAYRLAVRHPERVTALVAAAAVSQQYVLGKAGLDERLMLHTSVGNWMMRFLTAHAPKTTVASTLKAEGDLSRSQLAALVKEAVADDRQRDLVLAMATAASDHARRHLGMDNDAARFAEITTLELERVTAPALLVHGTADSDVAPAHTDTAAAGIAGAERVSLEAGTHLALWVHPECHAIQRRAADLLRNA